MDVLTRQAFGFLNAGRADKAISLFEQALEADPAAHVAAFGLGIAHTGTGQPEKAVAVLQPLTEERPDFADAHVALSEALAKLGRHAEEAEALSTAVSLNPVPAPELLLRYGSALRRAGRFDEAEEVIAGLAAPGGQDIRALYEFALVALEDQRHGDAADRFEQIVGLMPDLVEGWVNLCIAAKNDRRTDRAIAAGEEAIRREPGLAAAHVAHGNALRAADRRRDALAAFDRAIELAPAQSEALTGRGLILMELGDIPGAVEVLRKAASLAPRQFRIANNLSAALRMDRRLDEAAEEARRAIDLAPDLYDGYNNLANALRDGGHLTEAEGAYRTALERRPGYAAVMGNLANVLRDLVRPDEALALNREAVMANPADDVAGTKLLFGLCQHPGIDPHELAAEHRAWAERFIAPAEAGSARDADPDPDRVIRVGLVSPDFRAHSLRYFMEGLFRLSPRDRFHVTGFAEVARPDRETERIRGMMDGWVNTTGLSRQRFARAVREAGIDILVDLAGHTANSRLESFGERLAPLQVEWGGGYAFTTGLAELDVLLADPIVVPEGQEGLYSEKVLRLEHCFTSYDPPANAPEVAPLPALSKGYVTFGSISRTSKLNEQVIDTWAAILNRVEGSRLFLKDRGLADAALGDHVRDLFAKRGISAERLTIEGPSSHEATMAAYADIDIALDPFPNSGGITLCEAMWLGVPVVALEGNFFLARVGASLIGGAGHPEWVASTDDEYVRIAAGLAADSQRLADIRSRLRHDLANSKLCNVSGYGEEIGNVFIELWQQYCANTVNSQQ
jgi:predicted O-linked N-acetylglucosamine transferase (SPINDLY family)